MGVPHPIMPFVVPEDQGCTVVVVGVRVGLVRAPLVVVMVLEGPGVIVWVWGGWAVRDSSLVVNPSPWVTQITCTPWPLPWPLPMPPVGAAGEAMVGWGVTVGGIFKEEGEEVAFDVASTAWVFPRAPPPTFPPSPCPLGVHFDGIILEVGIPTSPFLPQGPAEPPFPEGTVLVVDIPPTVA